MAHQNTRNYLRRTNTHRPILYRRIVSSSTHPIIMHALSKLSQLLRKTTAHLTTARKNTYLQRHTRQPKKSASPHAPPPNPQTHDHAPALVRSSTARSQLLRRNLPTAHPQPMQPVCPNAVRASTTTAPATTTSGSSAYAARKHARIQPCTYASMQDACGAHEK